MKCVIGVVILLLIYTEVQCRNVLKPVSTAKPLDTTEGHQIPSSSTKSTSTSEPNELKVIAFPRKLRAIGNYVPPDSISTVEARSSTDNNRKVSSSSSESLSTDASRPSSSSELSTDESFSTEASDEYMEPPMTVHSRVTKQLINAGKPRHRKSINSSGAGTTRTSNHHVTAGTANPEAELLRKWIDSDRAEPELLTAGTGVDFGEIPSRTWLDDDVDDVQQSHLWPDIGMRTPALEEDIEQRNSNPKRWPALTTEPYKSKTEKPRSTRRTKWKRKASHERYALEKPVMLSVKPDHEKSNAEGIERLLENLSLAMGNVTHTSNESSLENNTTPIPGMDFKATTVTPINNFQKITTLNDYHDTTHNTDGLSLQTESSVSNYTQQNENIMTTQSIVTPVPTINSDNSTSDESLDTEKSPVEDNINSTDKHEQIPASELQTVPAFNQAVSFEPSIAPGTYTIDISKPLEHHPFTPIDIPLDVVDTATRPAIDDLLPPIGQNNPKSNESEGTMFEVYSPGASEIGSSSQDVDYEDELIPYDGELPKKMILDRFKLTPRTQSEKSLLDGNSTSDELSSNFKEFLKRNGIEVLEPNYTSNNSNLNTTIIIDNKKEIPQIYLEEMAVDPERFQSRLQAMQNLGMTHIHPYDIKHPKSDEIQPPMEAEMLVPNVQSSPISVLTFPPGLSRPYPMHQTYLERNRQDELASLPDEVIQEIVISKPGHNYGGAGETDIRHLLPIREHTAMITKRRINTQGMNAQRYNQPDASLSRVKLKPLSRLHFHLKPATSNAELQRHFLERESQTTSNVGHPNMDHSSNIAIHPVIPPPTVDQQQETIIYQPKKGEILFSDDSRYPELGRTYFEDYVGDKTMYPSQSSQYPKPEMHFNQPPTNIPNYNDEKVYQPVANKRIKRFPQYQVAKPTLVYDNGDTYFDGIW